MKRAKSLGRKETSSQGFSALIVVLIFGTAPQLGHNSRHVLEQSRAIRIYISQTDVKEGIWRVAQAQLVGAF